jgi:hypothetical protein
MLRSNDAHNRGPADGSGYRAGQTSEAASHVCPVCQGLVLRIGRRPVDKLTSLFAPVQRYRCETFSCGWEGNFRVANAGDDEPASRTGDRLKPVRPASMLKLAMTFLFVVLLVLVTVGWYSMHVRQSAKSNGQTQSSSPFEVAAGQHG